MDATDSSDRKQSKRYPKSRAFNTQRVLVRTESLSVRYLRAKNAGTCHETLCLLLRGIHNTRYTTQASREYRLHAHTPQTLQQNHDIPFRHDWTQAISAEGRGQGPRENMAKGLRRGVKAKRQKKTSPSYAQLRTSQRLPGRPNLFLRA